MTMVLNIAHYELMIIIICSKAFPKVSVIISFDILAL